MIATRYNGDTTSSQLLLTVGAGKLVKVLFRLGNNYASAVSSGDSACLELNGRTIAGTKNDSVETEPYDGEKLDINDNGSTRSCYVSGTSPLVMMEGETLEIYSYSNGRFKYDFIVLEETL